MQSRPPGPNRAGVALRTVPGGAVRAGASRSRSAAAFRRPATTRQRRPKLYADIRALYMQPGAHRTGEALIRAAGDAAEAGDDLRARREILGDIAPIAEWDPLRLATMEFGQPGVVLPGGGAGMVGRRGGNLVETSARNQPGRPSVPNVLGSEVKNIGTQVQGRFPTTP